MSDADNDYAIFIYQTKKVELIKFNENLCSLRSILGKKKTYAINHLIPYWIILVFVICNKIEFCCQKWYLCENPDFQFWQVFWSLSIARNSCFFCRKMVECILWYWSIPLVFSKSSLDDLHQDEAKKQEKRKTTLITLYYSSYCHLVTKWEWKDKK